MDFDFDDLFDQIRECIQSSDSVDFPGALDTILDNFHKVYGDVPVDKAFMNSPQGQELIDRIAGQLEASREEVYDSLMHHFDISMDSFMANAETPTVPETPTAPEQSVKTDDDSKPIPFTGAGPCNLCGCGHYVGGDSMDDVCTCSHKKWQHEWIR